MLSCDMLLIPEPVSVAAGAIAAVSAAGAASFFGPQPTSTRTAAIIMVFFIVAPDMLGFGTTPTTSTTVAHGTAPNLSGGFGLSSGAGRWRPGMDRAKQCIAMTFRDIQTP